MFKGANGRVLNRRETEYINRKYGDFLKGAGKHATTYSDMYELAHIGIYHGLFRSKKGITASSKLVRDEIARKYYFRAIKKYLQKMWEEKSVTSYISDIEGTMDGWSNHDNEGLSFMDSACLYQEWKQFSVDQCRGYLRQLFGVRRAKQILSGEEYTNDEEAFILGFKKAVVDMETKHPGSFSLIERLFIASQQEAA